MRGNQVELFAEIRQWCLRIDPANDAVNAEEFGRAAEERFVIGIEADSFVTE